MKKLLWLLLAFPSQCYAAPVIQESVKFYAVAPSSKADLIASLQSSSPIRQGGKTFHGYTRYNIKWRFKWKESKNHCRLTQVKTTLNIHYTMPKLISSKKGIKDIWAKWYPKLAAHEENHGRLAKVTAQKIDNLLHSMPAHDNCKTLEQEANKEAYALMKVLKEANRLYDLKTNHGKTEGAWIRSHMKD